MEVLQEYAECENMVHGIVEAIALAILGPQGTMCSEVLQLCMVMMCRYYCQSHATLISVLVEKASH